MLFIVQFNTISLLDSWSINIVDWNSWAVRVTVAAHKPVLKIPNIVLPYKNFIVI